MKSPWTSLASLLALARWRSDSLLADGSVDDRFMSPNETVLALYFSVCVQELDICPFVWIKKNTIVGSPSVQLTKLSVAEEIHGVRSGMLSQVFESSKGGQMFTEISCMLFNNA